ncbi:hypothetical protein AMAG_19775 [Allomyces macrogynus ATCC 38327]|uniref:Helitron helicase-like domain-containing protein n=1 Tax=Allomyces macrogynus (strain ATCC 38327) TaxID=578462 RepID=A0A0L0T233_ALLM3|nr:hypothetical protein AMAG_19775 [Allomyces macrogynus ATCC 38327]|eukprot:KNE68685.1 hypothetical protein AMAG_19775 [Allomyces macrogynus ATCC 38327]
MFVVHSLRLKRAVSYETKLWVRQSDLADAQNLVASSSPEVLKWAIEDFEQGGITALDALVIKLLQKVRTVSAHVVGSPAWLQRWHNELKALMVAQGLLSHFATFNPTDTHRRLVPTFAGAPANSLDLPDGEYQKAHAHRLLVALDLVAVTGAFDLLVTSVLDKLLKPDIGTSGVLSPAASFYGLVEAQGRGSLHIHVLFWSANVPHFSAIANKVRTVDKPFMVKIVIYLDTTIKQGLYFREGMDAGISNATYIPPLKHGYIPAWQPWPEEVTTSDKEDFSDVFLLVMNEAVIHGFMCTCSVSCEKKVPGVCRFHYGSNGEELRLETTIAAATASAKPARTHRWVNSHNPYILAATMSSNDIQSMFLGDSNPHGAVNYLTNYVTKSTPSTHNTQAILVLLRNVVQNATVYEAVPDLSVPLLVRGVVSRVVTGHEMSGQQVAHLLQLQDSAWHCKSDTFVDLHLYSIVSMLNNAIAENGDPDVMATSELQPLLQDENVKVDMCMADTLCKRDPDFALTADYLLCPADIEEEECLYTFMAEF